jgi:hypothetical protein
MKVQFQKSLLIGLSLLATTCIPVKAANTFTFGSSQETLLYGTDFGTSFNGSGWEMGTTATNQDVLKASINNWSRAYYNFAGSGYDLDDGELNFYLSFKTDRRRNEASKVYLELNFTENRHNLSNPANIPFEEAHVSLNLRPSLDNRPYQLYYDPAYCPDANTCPIQDRDSGLQEMRPPTGSFANTSVFESFRLSAKKIGNNLLEFTPYYWSNTTNQWLRFASSNAANTTPVSMTLDTSQSPVNYYINGLDSFQSFSLLFRGNIPAVDGVAVTLIPNSQSTAAKTPEPTSLLGLFALSSIALAAKFCNKQA